VALSGGSTADGMLEALVTEDVPWPSVHVYQVDERVAPDGDPDRNATRLREILLDRAPIPPGNVHLMAVTEPDLERAARDYASLLPRLDVVHLGLGVDGHTASWPPGDTVVEAPEAVAVVGPYHGRLRMTITPAAVAKARRVVFLVTGAAKHEALVGLLVGDTAVPAARVPLADAVIYCDEDARG
jgi:6-phosphogluconolactonase